MTSSAVDQNRGLVTLFDSSRLELMVLDPDTPEEDVAAFVAMHNERWRFHTINEDTFRRRIERGTMIGSYLDNEPATLLETTTLNLEGIVEIENAIKDYKERAYEVCKLIHARYPNGYYDLTNNGEWNKDDINPNVLMMVDITTARKFERRGFASALITYFMTILLEQKGFQCPSHLKDLKYILTFTPKPNDYTNITYENGSIGLHIANGAFNTSYTLPKARPGHTQPDAIFGCYLATGYVPQLNGIPIHRNIGV